MSKYTEHDANIIAAIKDGCVRFSEIVARTGYEYRLVDRRLQSMRRIGQVSFGTTYGWDARTNAKHPATQEQE